MTAAQGGTPDVHPSARLRVVFLLPTFDIGGAERVVLRTAAALVRARYEVTVAAFAPGTGRLRNELESAGVEARLVGPERTRFRATLAVHLWRWLRAARPDVLCTYMFHANQAGRIAGRLASVPVIVSSERVVGWEPWYRMLVNRLTAPLASVVTTNSEAGRRFWGPRLGSAGRRMEVIYNGVDVDWFLPASPPPGPIRIGTVARLHRANGHEWLIQALQRLQEMVPDGWIYVVAGDGPEEAAVRELVARARLTGRVVFTGHVADPRPVYQSLHIYVHPSLVAGMPNAVLEAMACGLPVVATRVGGTPEAVEDGVTGRLVEPGAVEHVAEILAELGRSEALRRKMAEAARARAVSTFSVNAMVDRTEALLHRLAGATARRRAARTL